MVEHCLLGSDASLQRHTKDNLWVCGKIDWGKMGQTLSNSQSDSPVNTALDYKEKKCSQIYLHFYWSCITVLKDYHSCQYFVLSNLKICQSNHIKWYIIIIFKYVPLWLLLKLRKHPNKSSGLLCNHSIATVVSEGLKVFLSLFRAKIFNEMLTPHFQLTFHLQPLSHVQVIMRKAEQTLVTFVFWV